MTRVIVTSNGGKRHVLKKNSGSTLCGVTTDDRDIRRVTRDEDNDAYLFTDRCPACLNALNVELEDF